MQLRISYVNKILRMKNSSPLRFYYLLWVAYWLSICKYEITLKTVYIWVDLIYFFTIYVDYFFVATTVLNLSTVRALLCTHCFIKHPKREGETCEICRSGFYRISVIFVAAIENFNLHYVRTDWDQLHRCFIFFDRSALFAEILFKGGLKRPPNLNKKWLWNVAPRKYRSNYEISEWNSDDIFSW